MDFIKINITHLINLLENYGKSISINIITFLLANLTDFISYLAAKDILNLGLGILLGSQISKITIAITDLLIKPILNSIIIFNNDKFENLTFSIFTIEFKIGEILLNLIQFMGTLFCLYLIWKLSTQTNYKDIESFLENLKLKLTE
jgi:large-conductance mechanosensitive channel